MRALAVITRIMIGFVCVLFARPLMASELRVELRAEGGKAAVVARTVNGKSQLAPEPAIVSGKTTIDVRCSAGLDCTRVGARLLVNLLPQLSFTTFPAVFDAQDGVLEVLFDGSPVKEATFNLKAEGAGANRAATPTKASTDPVALAAEACDNTFQPQGEPYDQAGNKAIFVVRPSGQVLWRPPAIIDEDDTVEVVVWAPKELEPFLVAKRTSTIRVPALRVLGAGEKVPGIEKLAAEKVVCTAIHVAQLQDFAPGRGEVQITVHSGDKDTAVGTFDFVVNPLYDGMLSLGAFRTKLLDQGFTLAPKGDDKVIVPTVTGDHEIRYAVFYTPFVWGKRDLEKKPLKFIHRFNPTVGITTKDFGSHGLLGVAFDYGSLLFIGGRHFARTTVLSDSVDPSKPFKGEASTIPTVRKWDSSWFFGVALDLRAAVTLFKAVVGSGSSQ